VVVQITGVRSQLGEGSTTLSRPYKKDVGFRQIWQQTNTDTTGPVKTKPSSDCSTPAPAPSRLLQANAVQLFHDPAAWAVPLDTNITFWALLQLLVSTAFHGIPSSSPLVS